MTEYKILESGRSSFTFYFYTPVCLHIQDVIEHDERALRVKQIIHRTNEEGDVIELIAVVVPEVNDYKHLFYSDKKIQNG